MSCSVVRRVALPDAFFAIDGLFETFLTVLDEFGAYPAVIERELDRYLPFLATTKVLMAAVRAGVGPRAGPRGHQGARRRRRPWRMREEGAEGNDLFERLAADDRASASTPATLDGVAGRPARRSSAPPPRRSAAFVAEVDGARRPLPRGRRATDPAPIL